MANHSATLLSSGPDTGKVLLAGGVEETGQARNTAELFNPKSECFSATLDMVSAHASHIAALINDGTVLLAGGVDAGGHAQAAVELFDTQSGKFSSTGSLVTGRRQHIATLITRNGGQAVLVTGRVEVSNNILTSAEIYQ